MNKLNFNNLLDRLHEKVGKPASVSKEFCEKCGRNYELHLFEDGREVKLGCDCEMIAAGKEATRRNKELAKKRQIASIYKKSIINPELEKATFETYIPKNESQRKALYICNRYADRFTLDNPASLMLKGAFGTGKSHLAMSIAKQVKDKGYTTLFMNVPQLITQITATYKRDSKMTELEIINLLQSVDLLVLDDIGVDDSSQAIKKVFQVVEGRAGKHTVFTTNMNVSELTENKASQRVFSRLNGAYPVEVEGDDHRSWKVRVDNA